MNLSHVAFPEFMWHFLRQAEFPLLLPLYVLYPKNLVLYTSLLNDKGMSSRYARSYYSSFGGYES
jgi:hypothetical protein